MSKLIPNGWLEAGLEYFCEINPRLQFRAALTNDTEVSFLKMEDVSNSAKITNKNVRKYAEVAKGFTTFQDDDVLVAKITPCFENGKGGYAVGLKNGFGFGSTEFHVLRSKDKSDSHYLYHFTNYKSFRLEAESNMTGSAGQRRVPTDFFRTYPAVFPPLPEQQKIAAILTAVDDVIESTQAQINKLKDLKTGMMQELLTKGIGHTEFKDSPVGRIPLTWEVVAIKDVCSSIVDCVNKTAPVVDYPTPYKMIRTTNVRNGRVDTENVRYVTQDTYELWTRRTPPQSGDVIFTREAPVGEVGMLRNAKGIFLGQRTMMYRVHPEKSDNLFLLYSLQSEYCKKQIEDFSGGSTVAHMRVPDCGEILVKAPPLKEQKKIAAILTSIEQVIENKELKENRLKEKKKGPDARPLNRQSPRQNHVGWARFCAHAIMPRDG